MRLQKGIELLLETGIPAVSAQLLALKERLINGLGELGFQHLGPRAGTNASGITSVWREQGRGAAEQQVFDHLATQHMHPSLRYDRAGRAHLRFSPHFYNTLEEMDRVVAAVAEV